jgi:hypothetical protein
MPQQPHNRKGWVETCLWPWPTFPIGVIVLLVGSFLYVWLRVEPVLEYHSYGPYFFRQRAFMEPFLGRPGGLASYAGVFLAQFSCLNWLGALVFVLSECVVLLAALVCLVRITGQGAGKVGRDASPRRPQAAEAGRFGETSMPGPETLRPPRMSCAVLGWVAMVPVFVLLLLRNRHGCPVPAMSVGLILALAAAAAHILLPWRCPWLAMAVSGLISGLLFYLAGLWSALLFAVLCGLYVVIQMRSRLAALGCVVLGLATPLLVIGAGSLEIAGLVNPWPGGGNWVLTAVLYASVPVAGAVLALLAKPATTPPTTGPGRWFQTAWRGQAVVVLAFLLGWVAVWLTFDRRQKLLAEMDYAAGCGQYEAVLAAARQVKVLDHPAKVRLLLALYRTGRLAEDLFSFHDMVEETLSEGIGEDYRAQSQPLLELGLVNDAEHTAHEALELEGDRPDLLRLLARINVLKDRPQAAQVLLNVLSLIPFQGERASAAWPTSDPQMPAAERAWLGQMRARMLTNDVLHDGLPMERLLNVLLAANPTNQMAFEYQMAYDMLDLDLKQAVEHLRLLDNFNYARIPRPYEEAVLLYQQLAGVQVELKGRAIRPETAGRFRQFGEAARQLAGSTEAQAAIAANFGGTYWYYYFAARSRQQAAEGQAPGS